MPSSPKKRGQQSTWWETIGPDCRQIPINVPVLTLRMVDGQEKLSSPFAFPTHEDADQFRDDNKITKFMVIPKP